MERNIVLDVVKLILAFFVVALHCSIFNDINYDISFLLKNGVFRIAVPIFLIITGYYFVNINNLERLKKWIVRIFLLYIIWMIFYIPFWFESSLSLFTVVRNTIIFILGYNHLWYLSGTLLGGCILYLLRNVHFKKQMIIAVICFLCGVLIQYLGNLHIFSGTLDKVANVHYVSRNAITVCFPFMFLGFVINKLNLVNKFKTSYLIVIAIFSLILLEFESYLNLKYISRDQPLDLMFILIFVCPLLFLISLKFFIMSSNKNIGFLSSGLYLIHPFVIYLLFDYELSSIVNYSLVIFISLILSVFLIFLQKKINFIL